MPSKLKEDGPSVAEITASKTPAAQAASIREIVENRVDAAKRDALVPCMLHKLKANPLLQDIRDAEQLHAYLLLDVNVSSAVTTTPMMAAISSVQLYGHRVVDGIEAVDGFADKPRLLETWTHAREYRLWEANKKLELFPEQYVTPEVVRGASRQYQAFQDALGQGRLGDDVVRRVLSPYLADIAAQGQARLGGMSQHVGDDGVVQLCLTARGAGDAGSWFLRTLRIRAEGVDGTAPWEEIKVAIAKNPHTVPTPIHLQGRISLFWTEIEEEMEPGGKKLTYIRIKRSQRIAQGDWAEPVTVKCESMAATGGTVGEPLAMDARPTVLKDDDGFGLSVALTPDGATLAVGAPFESGDGKGVNPPAPDSVARTRSGAAYVFHREGFHWVQHAYVKASNPDAEDMFGTAVALSRDGLTLAVGAVGERSNSLVINAGEDNNDGSAADPPGAVYVFTYQDRQWKQQAYVKPSRSSCAFGASLCLTDHGNLLLVGAPRDTAQAGAVFIFRRAGISWAEQQRLVSPHPDPNDKFGATISCSRDARMIAVGVPGEGSAATTINGSETDNSAPSAGAVYVFTRSEQGLWAKSAYIKASNAGAEDLFGSGLAFHRSGGTLAVGAAGEDGGMGGINPPNGQGDNSRSGAGAVYLFSLRNGGWQQDMYLKAPVPQENAAFGSVLALDEYASPHSLAVGAPNAIVDTQRGGVVHLYKHRNGAWAPMRDLHPVRPASNGSYLKLSLTSDAGMAAVGPAGPGAQVYLLEGDEDAQVAEPRIALTSHVTDDIVFDARRVELDKWLLCGRFRLGGSENNMLLRLWVEPAQIRATCQPRLDLHAQEAMDLAGYQVSHRQLGHRFHASYSGSIGSPEVLLAHLELTRFAGGFGGAARLEDDDARLLLTHVIAYAVNVRDHEKKGRSVLFKRIAFSARAPATDVPELIAQSASPQGVLSGLKHFARPRLLVQVTLVVDGIDVTISQDVDGLLVDNDFTDGLLSTHAFEGVDDPFYLVSFPPVPPLALPAVQAAWDFGRNYQSRDGSVAFHGASPAFVNGPNASAHALRFEGRALEMRAEPVGGVSSTEFGVALCFRCGKAGPLIEVVELVGGVERVNGSLAIDGAGKIKARLLNAEGTQYEELTTPGSFNDGQWHQVVQTFGAAVSHRLFVDGVQAAVGTLTRSAGHPTRLRFSSPSAEVARLELFNQSLSAEQAEALYGRDGLHAKMLAWDFNFSYDTRDMRCLLRGAAPEFVPGISTDVAQALRFTGGLRPMAATVPEGVPWNDWTLSFWFRCGTPNSMLIGTAGDTALTLLERDVFLNGEGSVRCSIRSPGISPGNELTSPPGYADGKWHHLVLTVVPGGPPILYLDGVEEARGALVPMGSTPVPVVLYVGERDGPGFEEITAPRYDLARLKFCYRGVNAAEARALLRVHRSTAVRLFSETTARLSEQTHDEFLYESPRYAQLQWLPEKDSQNFVSVFEGRFHPLNVPPASEFSFPGYDGNYGWEIFFYMPWLVARRFMDTGDCERARQWLHCIFDPRLEDKAAQWVCRPLNLPATTWRAATDPDEVARQDPLHYQKAIRQQYFDILMAAGDALYRLPTRERMHRAQMYYLSAKDLIGAKPLIALDEAQAGDAPTLGSVTEAYFRMPMEPKRFGNWEQVDRRISNLRHNLSIDGVPLNPSLLEPPVDPKVLESGGANGRGGQAITPSATALPSPYRFGELLERARRFVLEFEALGQALRQALEAVDADSAEQQVLDNQVRLLELGRFIQDDQIRMEEHSLKALERSLEAAGQRVAYYEQLYEENISGAEQAALALLTASGALRLGAAVPAMVGAVIACFPKIFGVAVGGQKPENVPEALATAMLVGADAMDTSAHRIVEIEQYRRRREEWQMLARQSAQDRLNLDELILAARRRIGQAEKTLRQQEVQIEQARASATVLKNRFGNAVFLSFVKGRLTSHYSAAFLDVLALCQQVELSYQYELGEFDSAESCFKDVWDEGHHGLLAGQSLLRGLQRLEYGHLKRNERRFEILKTFSLKALKPDALEELKAHGKVDFDLTEEHFDRDYPGHYLRQIKNLSLSFPALLGPYQEVAATLTQLSNTIYTAPRPAPPPVTAPPPPAPPAPAPAPERPHKKDWRARQQIALSQGVGDSGLFELDFNDSRYLPFEGTGVESRWQLEFPGPRDMLASLNDVIVQVRYTARRG